MFSIRKIQPLEQLLLESDLIKFGSEVASAINSEIDKDTQLGQTGSNSSWNKIDNVIDALLEKGIIDIAQDLKKPIFEKELGTEFSKEKIKQYLSYCQKRNSEIIGQIKSLVELEQIDNLQLQELTVAQIKISSRIQVLEKVYAALRLTNRQEIIKIANSVLQQIESLKLEFAKSYSEVIETFATKVKQNIAQVEDPKAGNAEKTNSAENVIITFDSIDEISQIYPPEIKAGLDQARDRAEQTIKKEIGEDAFNELKQQTLSNKQEAAILRRIVSMKYVHFTKEEEVYKEADQIKQQINGLLGSNRSVYKHHSASSQEVVDYLTSELTKATNEILIKIKDKSLSLDKTKGIHYNFSTKLRLHELTDLPVTGKQIADASLIMKLRKAISSVLGAIPGADLEMTQAGRAWADFGQYTHNTYAKVLNSSAKFVGRLFGKRQGEIRADAISRLFIPGTSVLDKKKSGPVLFEEVGPSPGSAIQTPGTISGMGAIKAPTPTEFGSGDKFSPEKKKKKKRNVYEEKLEILDFANFIKQNNTL